MPELTVLVTSEPGEALKKIIEGLKCDPGYGQGREVRKDENVPGKYILIKHNGEQDLTSQSVRVVGSDILAGKAAGILEAELRKRKIPYSRFDSIEITNPNAIDLVLKTESRHSSVVYTPQLISQ